MQFEARPRVWILVALLWTCACGSASAAPIAHLVLHSQVGDYIGRGGDFDITYFGATETVVANGYRVVNGRPRLFLFNLDDPKDVNMANVEFGTNAIPADATPGTYLNAQRADFASPGRPGLDIAFQHRGSNTVTGSFTIDYVTFSGSSIDTFQATFEQHGDGLGPALFGTFTYSANGVLPGGGGASVPLPVALWAGVIAATPMFVIVRTRRRKADRAA